MMAATRRGINHGALTHQQRLDGQVLVDGLENGAGQIMGFEQSAKPQQRGGIRGGFAVEVYADKVANGLAVENGVFRGLIRDFLVVNLN